MHIMSPSIRQGGAPAGGGGRPLREKDFFWGWVVCVMILSVCNFWENGGIDGYY